MIIKLYIGEFNKQDKAFKEMPEFNDIYLHPYRYHSLINGDKWDYFMKTWCGYAPEQGKLNDVISYLEEIKQMPCYPDDGSIKIIDNNIVIKFADVYE